MAFSTGVLVLLTCCCLLTRAVQENSNPSNDIEVDKKAISKTNSLWTDCSRSSDPMTIYSVSIAPSPLRRGQEVYAAMTAELGQDVNSGRVSVILRYANIMTILRKKYNLCSFLEQSGSSCPLSKGTVTLTWGTTIPSSLPPGQYTGSIVAVDENGQELACVSLNINMGA